MDTTLVAAEETFNTIQVQEAQEDSAAADKAEADKDTVQLELVLMVYPILAQAEEETTMILDLQMLHLLDAMETADQV
jgi:hypothetical protein